MLPYNSQLHATVFERPSRLNLVVGCVDNGAARRAIAATLDAEPYQAHHAWWLDAGNGRNDGQVLLGNATRPEQLQDNVKASGVKLDAELLKAIDEILDPIVERDPAKTESPAARP